MIWSLLPIVLLAGSALAEPQGGPRRYPETKGNLRGFPFVDPLVDDPPLYNPYNAEGKFIDWKTYKSNGVNLGSWLEKEKTHDPIWWSEVGGDSVSDEWASTLLSSNDLACEG